MLAAARETGYRPNIVSRSLRTGTSQTIGFVSDTVATTPFAGHVIWGALDAARERDHLLFIGETEGDPELERQLIETMHDRRVDGIVLASMYTRKVAVPKALLDGQAVAAFFEKPDEAPGGPFSRMQHHIGASIRERARSPSVITPRTTSEGGRS